MLRPVCPRSSNPILGVFWWALLPLVVVALPPGFVKEYVLDGRSATTGRWAKNPRKNGKPMLIYASDKGGIRVMENPDESNTDTKILDLRLENGDLCTNGERGMQTIALHPKFDQNFFIYVFYSSYVEGCGEGYDNSPPNVVDRFKMDPETLQLEKRTRKEIWRSAPGKKTNHNGGAMAFGNDGKLYITTGDNGDRDAVQPLDNTHGSLIRLNDDGSVPSDNPYADPEKFESYRFADSGGRVPKDASKDAVCSEVFANGFRNPFRLQMDPSTASDRVRMAISDVGGNYWEELNWAGTDYAGKNYGYPEREGPCEHGTADVCAVPRNREDPFHWYAHRRLREGGCVAGSVMVPEDAGWPTAYKLLVADFIFFEIYNLIEDPDAACRDCLPPLPGYRNTTLYQVPSGAEPRGSITDMVFGPYKDTQALYVFLRGGKESVIRIRYTADVKNTPPVPVIEFDPLKHNLQVGEELLFDGSKSKDPDGDALAFQWDFGDGTTYGDGVKSGRHTPIHTYEEPGEYVVTLVVMDTAGISQQTSITLSIGDPPTASILSPADGEEFFVGQIFKLQGEAFDSAGKRLEDSSLSWEVRQHHADHFHPFLDPTPGNDLSLFPAPEPEDFLAATNSYLRIILRATDTNGLTTEVDRLVQPVKLNIRIDSNHPDLEVMVEGYPVTTTQHIVSWDRHMLRVEAEDQRPYLFKSWWDGYAEKERTILLTQDRQMVRALYCLQDNWSCVAHWDCCSGVCESETCKGTTAATESSDILDDEELSNDSEISIAFGSNKEDEASKSNDIQYNTIAEGIALDSSSMIGSSDASIFTERYFSAALVAAACGLGLIAALLLIRSRRKENLKNSILDEKRSGGEGPSTTRSEDEETGPSDASSFASSNDSIIPESKNSLVDLEQVDAEDSNQPQTLESDSKINLVGNVSRLAELWSKDGFKANMKPGRHSSFEEGNQPTPSRRLPQDESDGDSKGFSSRPTRSRVSMIIEAMEKRETSLKSKISTIIEAMEKRETSLKKKDEELNQMVEDLERVHGIRINVGVDDDKKC